MFTRTPKFIEIETSRFCNRKCSWCPNGNYNARTIQELMNWELFVKILDELSEMNYSGWFAFHNYNEPLLNPRLFKELDLLKTKLPSCHACIFTNGDYLTMELIKSLSNAGVAYLRVTRYPPTHNREQDIKPSNKRIMQWIKVKALDRILWHSETLRQGLAAIAIQDDMRIEVISPNLKTYNYRGGTAIVPTDASRKMPCHMTAHSASIDYRGRFKMCCNVYPENIEHTRYVIGDLNQKPFRSLWESSTMQELRKMHSIADWSKSPICEKCIQSLDDRKQHRKGGSPG